MTTRRNVLLGFSAMVLGGSASAVTISRPGTAFGTVVSIAVTTTDKATANRAIDAGFAEIRAVHKAASLFDVSSEVSRLNRAGRLDGPSQYFSDIIEQSDRLHAITNGAFDPSIQPLWRLWSMGKPSDHDLKTALANVGWRKLNMASKQLTLQSGAALSFNGIAQGYAADRVMTALKNAGAFSASVNTGEAGRMNADGFLQIQHPRQPKAIGKLKLQNGFVAVSGDYATTFTPDFEHHHIFDPTLGFSPRELASVVVVSPTGAMADGLATAFMVMGVAKAMDCLKTLAGSSAVFVDKTGHLTLSPGMENLFQKT